MFNICIYIHIWWSNFEIPFGLNRLYGELINFSGDNRSLAQSLLEAIDRPRTNDRFSATRHSEYLVFVQEAMVGFTLGPFPANWLVSIGLARSWPFPMIGFIDLASFGISSERESNESQGNFCLPLQIDIRSFHVPPLPFKSILF